MLYGRKRSKNLSRKFRYESEKWRPSFSCNLGLVLRVTFYNRLGMFDWFRKKETPLTGAPAVRRQKTHSAESGYVYQYFYEGQRAAKRDRAPGTQYVFNVSADRKSSFPVSVFVSDSAFDQWQKEHGRELSSTERYAVAKLALFQAFDQRESPAAMSEEVVVQASDVAAFLATLDIS